MKLLLLSLFATAATTLQAQEAGNLDKTKLLERALQFKMSGRDTVPQPAVKILMEKLQHGRVRVLPQDGMPFIVPGTSGIAAIPNAFKSEAGKDPIPGRIPNAWQMPKAVPDGKGAK